MKYADVAIIGGGPAGMAAALAAREAGAGKVVILERDARLGGILEQCIHNGFGLHRFHEELTGPEYAERYEQMVQAQGITCLCNTMVVDLTQDRRITAVNQADGYFQIEAKAVVLAMGCREKPRGALVTPGTRPAGVMTAGTAQKFVNLQGYLPGRDFMLAMDAAASEWKSPKGKGFYKLPKAGTEFTSAELIAHWKSLVEKYPIISIEDGLDEEDWEGWQQMTRELGGKVQLVGDDLFVTNTERLAKGIQLGAGNAILIKLNQIGSVSETLEAIKMAHKAGYNAISSHRSGETEDTTIADLAVALNTCQIKTGAPSRTERVAKYNQLLRIEEQLGESAVYPGMEAF